MKKKLFGFVFALVFLFTGLTGGIIRNVNAIAPEVLTLITEPISGITANSAGLSASWKWTGVWKDTDIPPTTIWFEYGTTPNAYDSNWKKTKAHTINQTIDTEGGFSTGFDSPLTTNTKYYYRVAGLGNGNPSFGNIESFATLKVEPKIVTEDASDIKEDSATITGTFSKSYFSNFSVGFEYSTSADTIYWKKTKPVLKNTDFDSYSFSLKGLDSDTNYYYRAIEIVGNDDYFGAIKEFKTPESAATLAKVNSTTLSYSTVTDNSVRVKVSGYIAKGEYVFELYSQNTYPGGEYAVPPVMYTNPINANAIEVAFTGLQPNYDYVAVFDKYTPGMIGNTVDAADVQFTTPAPPGGGPLLPEDPKTPNPKKVSTPTLPSTATSGVVPDCGKVVTTMGADGKEVTTMANPCTFRDLLLLLNNVIKFLLFNIATPLIALILMYTGYLYLTAGGKTGQTEKVRHILFNAVIGYIVALAAWLIVKTILSSLNVDPTIETFL